MNRDVFTVFLMLFIALIAAAVSAACLMDGQIVLAAVYFGFTLLIWWATMEVIVQNGDA